MCKLILEKAEEPEIKLPTSVGSWKKQENFRKTSISAFLTMPKPLTVTEELIASGYPKAAEIERRILERGGIAKN